MSYNAYTACLHIRGSVLTGESTNHGCMFLNSSYLRWSAHCHKVTCMVKMSFLLLLQLYWTRISKWRECERDFETMQDSLQTQPLSTFHVGRNKSIPGENYHPLLSKERWLTLFTEVSWIWTEDRNHYMKGARSLRHSPKQMCKGQNFSY